MLVFLLAMGLAAFPAAGGEIFGEIRAGDGYAASADLTVVCGKDSITAKTDSAGSFRVRTKATGRCQFSVTWKGEKPTVDVVVFERPTRYRLVIEERDGKLVLKRV
ncbi:MAG: hypothetical protein ACKVZ0_12745 [Gemmatimonadales bacterium]